MKIRLTPQVAIQLETAAVQARGMEYSGFGFVEIDTEKQEFVVYKAFILHVGSVGYTQIDPARILPILNEPDSRNLKCWFHRHPVGNGAPGPHNWSGTDNATIQNEPLGGNPKLVQWSISIVRTPEGWVGRVDNHLNGKTEHLEVEGQADPKVFELMRELRADKSVWDECEPKKPVAHFDDQLYVQESFAMLPAVLEDYRRHLTTLLDDMESAVNDGTELTDYIVDYIETLDNISDDYGMIPKGLDDILDKIEDIMSEVNEGAAIY